MLPGLRDLPDLPGVVSPLGERGSPVPLPVDPGVSHLGGRPATQPSSPGDGHQHRCRMRFIAAFSGAVTQSPWRCLVRIWIAT